MDCNIILNNVIEYIEKNLTNKIDYDELSKTVGMSGVTLQKIFCFLTNTSLSEYIRKRRLSMAAEDLILTNGKIIDIAIKYQYESSTSFGRAFSNMYGCTPKEVRTKIINLKTFPKFNFNINQQYCELNYRIEELEEKVLYGISTDLIEISDKVAIKTLWQSPEVSFLKAPNSKGEYYGITEYHTNSQMKYYILNEYEKTNLIKKVIPKTKWIIFRVNSKDQKDILEICNKIYNNWIETSNYNVIENYIDLEIYYDDYCEYSDLKAAWSQLMNDFNSLMNNEKSFIFQPVYMYDYQNNHYYIRDFTDDELIELDNFATLMLDCDKNLEKLYKIYKDNPKFKIMLGISTWN